MPRSMGHPDYVYRPWTPERRAKASADAKARAAAKRSVKPKAPMVSLRPTPEMAAVQLALDKAHRTMAAYNNVWEQLEEFVCAARFLTRLDPSRGDEIEALVKRIEPIIGW